MQNNIYKRIDKEYYFHKQQYQDEKFLTLVQNNSTNYFIDKDVEIGFKKAFLGNWGSQANTKKQGVVQDLNRLSFNRNPQGSIISNFAPRHAHVLIIAAVF